MASPTILSQYQNQIYSEYAAGFLCSNDEIFFDSSQPNGDRFIFDLASLTKVLVTSQIIFAMIYGGKFGLNSKLGDLLLEDDRQYFGPDLCDISIAALLSHQSGLPAWRNFWVNHLSTSEASHFAIRHVGRERWHEIGNQKKPVSSAEGIYSDVGYILLGELIEKLENKPINEVFYSFIAKYDLLPVSLIDEFKFAIDLSSPQLNQVVPTSFCPLRERVLCGEVHDENSASFGSLTGHAGLFGSYRALKEYLIRLSALELFGREIQSCRELSADTSFLLGWRRGSGESSKAYAQGQSFGHLGFTGTSIWFEPSDNGMTSLQILLTNRVWSSRVNPSFGKVRGEFSEFCEKKRKK
jgi:CubicO group peptidase (beta-lactamase class C family)